MSIENVREYLKQYGKDHAIIILDDSSATVELAAKALHTETMRIAKSLSFMVKDKAVIIVCAGDCRIDNHKYKEYFHVKARMLKPDKSKNTRIIPSAASVLLPYRKQHPSIWMFRCSVLIIFTRPAAAAIRRYV